MMIKHFASKVFLIILVIFSFGYITLLDILANKILVQPLQSNSLCKTDEQIIFSCAIKKSKKIVSLCGSKTLTNSQGYIQYRFGTANNTELEFPKELQQNQSKFTYSHYFRAQVDYSGISFVNNGYSYTIFDEYNGEEKPVVKLAGVRIAKGEQDPTELQCGSKPIAHWNFLEGVVRLEE
ncbi:MAG: hypothetical protein JNN15_04720 [Blastocatellia bacterium]|nr:hypothetical protein [Blastocatellia bacterium]